VAIFPLKKKSEWPFLVGVFFMGIGILFYLFMLWTFLISILNIFKKIEVEKFVNETTYNCVHFHIQLQLFHQISSFLHNVLLLLLLLQFVIFSSPKASTISSIPLSSLFLFFVCRVFNELFYLCYFRVSRNKGHFPQR